MLSGEGGGLPIIGEVDGEVETKIEEGAWAGDGETAADEAEGAGAILDNAVELVPTCDPSSDSFLFSVRVPLSNLLLED